MFIWIAISPLPLFPFHYIYRMGCDGSPKGLSVSRDSEAVLMKHAGRCAFGKVGVGGDTGKLDGVVDVKMIILAKLKCSDFI